MPRYVTVEAPIDIDDEVIIRGVPIDKLLERFGIDIIQWRHSAGYVCLCPFHADHSPSFAIQNDGDDKGRWNCYHDPDFKGDLFEFVARLKEVSRVQAKSLLIAWFGIDSVPVPDPQDLADQLAKLSASAESYPERIPLPRCVEDPNVIADYLLNDPGRKKSGYSRDDALEIVRRWGLQYAPKGYYAGRILIPIHDRHGRQVYYQAQAIDKKAIAHLPDPQCKPKLYPVKAPTPYHLHGLHRITGDYVIVVEGFWDLAALDLWGFPAVMSGAARLSKDQEALLIERFRRVWIWYDNDAKQGSVNPGQRAAKAACRSLALKNVEAWRVAGPPGDPDEVGGPEQAKKILRTRSIRYRFSAAPTADELESQLRA